MKELNELIDGAERRRANGNPSASAVSSSTHSSSLLPLREMKSWNEVEGELLANSTHPTHSKEKTKKFVFLWVVGEFS